MAILWFGGMDRYVPGKTSVVLPTYRANMPFPTWKGVRVRMNAQTAGYRIIELPNILEEGVRRWLQIETTNSTRNATTQYCELTFSSLDIPQEYKEVDNVICFGFRFRMTQVINRFKYLAFCKLIPTQNLNTGIGGLTASMEFPLETLQMHPLENHNTEEKYVEYRVRYRENNVCLIKIFVNKDLVLTKEVGWDEGWAILNGSPRGGNTWKVSVSSTIAAANKGACYYNDIYMSLDRKGDKVTTGMMGPVTAKTLELDDPITEGEWVTSNPDKTIKEILSEPLVDQNAVMSGDYVVTDYGDKPALIKFKPPVDEKLKIVAFQQGFIAQQPLAYSTSLQYMQTINGVSIEPDGWKTTINVALEPNYSHVRSDAISVQPDGSDITPEFIGSIGLVINSTKKLIEDDPVPEEEAPEEEVTD